MMLAKDIMRATGITRDALRHYVKHGLLTPRICPRNGYKQYTSADIERIRFIKDAQAIGFTIAQIKELLAHMETAACKHQSLLPSLRSHLEDINEKIATLRAMKRHITRLIKDFEQRDCTVEPSELHM